MKQFVQAATSLAFVVLVAASVPADAACSSSCTAMRDGCIKRGGNAAACSAGYAGCRKTGTYAGMPSGRTWTNVCRK